jgi:MscS family membrane protein
MPDRMHLLTRWVTLSCFLLFVGTLSCTEKPKSDSQIHPIIQSLTQQTNTPPSETTTDPNAFQRWCICFGSAECNCESTPSAESSGSTSLFKGSTTPATENKQTSDESVGELGGWIKSMYQDVRQFMGKKVLPFMDILILDLIIAAIIIFCSLILRRVLVTIVLRRLRKIAKRTKTEMDDIALEALNKPVGWFIVLMGIYISVLVISFPADVSYIVHQIVVLLIITNIAWMLLRFNNHITRYFIEHQEKTGGLLDDTILRFISKAGKVLTLIIALVFMIQNIGLSVDGLVAALGLGSVGLAFAARDILSNIFNSFSIFLDKPFKMGDWVISSSIEGNVEEIGFRSVKIRKFDKSLVTIPNNLIIDNPIINMTRRDMFGKGSLQRVLEYVSVTYHTRPNQMEGLVEAIRQIVLNNPLTWKENYQIYFTRFGESSLDILIYFFIETPTWGEYLREKEAIFLEIMHAVHNRGLEFAFPSQSIYMKQDEEELILPPKVSPEKDS